jgi:hypothetical protein
MYDGKAASVLAPMFRPASRGGAAAPFGVTAGLTVGGAPGLAVGAALAVDGGVPAVGALEARGGGPPQAATNPPSVVRPLTWMNARRRRFADV